MTTEEANKAEAEKALAEKEERRKQVLALAPQVAVVLSQGAALHGLATQVAKSQLVPLAYQGKPEDCYVAMLMGAELGVSPMQSLLNIDVIDGRPATRARLKATLAMRHPDCEYFQPIEVTPEKVTFETKRRQHTKPVQYSFTIEEARQAGLLRKSNWEKFPKSMLIARCESGLADLVYPEATLGLPPDDYNDDVPSTVTSRPASVVVEEPKAPQRRADEVAAALEKQLEKKVEDVEFKPIQQADCPTCRGPTALGGNSETPFRYCVNGACNWRSDAVQEPAQKEPQQAQKAPEPPKPSPPGKEKSTGNEWYDKAKALAKLRSIKADELNIGLKECGAKGPKDVNEDVYNKLTKYFEAKRQPGEDG